MGKEWVKDKWLRRNWVIEGDPGMREALALKSIYKRVTIFNNIEKTSKIEWNPSFLPNVER